MLPSIEQVQETTLYTRTEAALRLKVSLRTIDTLIASGKLRSTSGGQGGGRRLVTEKACRDYILASERKGK